MFSHGPQHKHDEINRSLVNTLLDIIAAPGWEEISSEDGVYIAKKGLAPEFEVAGQCLGDEAKFAVVMAQSVLEAPPEQVYGYFMDNTRVKDYNEYCTQVNDLVYLDAQTKISWSCSGTIAGGVVKKRDFVTRSHYCAMEDGTLVIANRAEEHEDAPSSDEYIRMRMVWGGNIIRPAAQAGHTHLTTVTHINPGGMGETRFGLVFINAMAATGPRKFVNGLRSCITRDREGEAQQRRWSLQSDHSMGTASSSSSGISSADTEENAALSPRAVTDESCSSKSSWGGWWWSAKGDEAGGQSDQRHCASEKEMEFGRKLREQLAVWQRRARVVTCTLPLS